VPPAEPDGTHDGGYVWARDPKVQPS
jgi:hypothetical protein